MMVQEWILFVVMMSKKRGNELCQIKSTVIVISNVH